jgi:hypothetical protein
VCADKLNPVYKTITTFFDATKKMRVMMIVMKNLTNDFLIKNTKRENDYKVSVVVKRFALAQV